MTETSTTSSHTLEPGAHDAVLAMGVMAVGLHAATHQLPAPLSIELSLPTEDLFVKVYVPGAGNQQRWLNTIQLDDQVELHFTDYSRFIWHGRLPETGTRIQLVGLRPASRPPQDRELRLLAGPGAVASS